MMPRLGEKYDIEIKTISKSPEEYNTDDYFELDLPVAPAVMVGDEVVVEGADVAEEKLDGAGPAPQSAWVVVPGAWSWV